MVTDDIEQPEPAPEPGPEPGVRGLGRRRRRPARRRSADRQPGRLRGSARPAAGAGAHAEGGPGQDLRAGAGRAVSGIHRPGAESPAGAGGRLSGDGGVAGVPEVEAAAAARGRSPRISPRGEELAARLAFRLMRLEAMRNAAGQLDDAQAARAATCSRAACRKACAPSACGKYTADDLRPAQGLRRSAPAARSSACTWCRGARCGRSRRRAQRLESAGRRWRRRSGCSSTCSCEQYVAMPGYRPHGAWPARSARRWKWRARAGRDLAGGAVRADLHAQARGRMPTWQRIS